ncbi:ribonuclease E inhibitor RraB [Archangium lipolyticum]|uniref:ribonuclease E inhibitor RraB n=1 Tax=Archangium lipolyticum TaxID=2970465 RepID=UPI00214A3040|nr:ribonuclease E inhibitor RraB [Archangium lipolyticum]
MRELNDEQRKLPIASIWNHEALVYSLTEEWRPEQDIGSPPEPEGTVASSAEPKSEESASDVSKPRHVRHYLYFTTAKVGKAVAAQLVTRGFEVTSRKSADGKNWLVLVEHFVSDGEQFDSARDSLEHLAQEHSGQYDGYELEVASHPK